jgi:hypothetical protein
MFEKFFISKQFIAASTGTIICVSIVIALAIALKETSWRGILKKTTEKLASFF